MTVSGVVNPSSPSVSLLFIFGAGGTSYETAIPWTTVNYFGESTLGTSIGLDTVTSALGIKCGPCSQLSIDINGALNTSYIAQLQGTGFSQLPSMTWASASNQTSTSSFIGSCETCQLGLQSLASSQTLSLSAGINLIVSLPIFSVSLLHLQIASGPVPILALQHLSVQTQYSAPTGDGWYLTGSTATFSIADTSLQFSQGQREVFSSWVGAYAGQQNSASIMMNGPAVEIAKWQTQFSVSVTQSAGGLIETNQSVWQNQGYSLALTAKPNPNYHFVRWIVNGQNLSGTDPYNYTIAGPTVISAAFAPNQQLVQTTQTIVETQTVQTTQTLILTSLSVETPQGSEPRLISGLDNNVLVLSTAIVVVGLSAVVAWWSRRH